MDATPLSSRITAPATLAVPVSDGCEWRPAQRDDLDAMMDCARAIDIADHPNYMTPREEVEEEFEHSYVDPATDSIVAITPEGRIDAWGFATLSPSQDTLVRAILFGGVRPDARGRGLGRQLVAWQEGRGRQHLASSSKELPGWIMSFAETRQPSAISTLQHAGFEIARYYLELRRDVSEPVSGRQLADSHSLRGRRSATSRCARRATTLFAITGGASRPTKSSGIRSPRAAWSGAISRCWRSMRRGMSRALCSRR